ncbi:uncharacterized protein LOC113351500 [Papaver somniferum]|uniref:uncharacterized protein LOC113351500 n=1 Tax=Papaver somniferum TaxID=3469 RepID=UPI000E702D80|nr:uncharacterized protein LOC113351500 [Papaver somniferum]
MQNSGGFDICFPSGDKNLESNCSIEEVDAIVPPIMNVTPTIDKEKGFTGLLESPKEFPSLSVDKIIDVGASVHALHSVVEIPSSVTAVEQITEPVVSTEILTAQVLSTINTEVTNTDGWKEVTGTNTNFRKVDTSNSGKGFVSPSKFQALIEVAEKQDHIFSKVISKPVKGKNVKGVPNVITRKQASTSVKSNVNMEVQVLLNPSLLWVAEPKIKVSGGGIKSLNLVGMSKMIIHNSSDTAKGNIWLFWNSSLSKPVVISSSSQAITVKVGDVMVTVIHAASITADKIVLWEEMIEISQMNYPWMIIRDFNVVLSYDEKVEGRRPLRVSMQDFRDCLESCNLIQSTRTGIKYSWCNNRVGKKRILCDLYKAFYNLKWLEKYDGWSYKVCVKGTSDHGPLFGSIVNTCRPVNAPFRYQHIWTSHLGFIEVIKNAWNEASSDADPENVELLNKLVTARGRHEIASQQYNELMRAKSRVKWIKEGGANTTFFHATIKLRQSQNNITELESTEGNVVCEQSQIVDILVDNYTKKFEYQNITIQEEILDVVPKVLNDEDNNFLDTVPTAMEIKEAVFNMNANIAPGPDGFPGCFYKFAWDIIGAELIEALRFCWTHIFIPKGAFIKGRNIHDKIVLASEMINELNIKRRGGNVGLKLDITQAYDSLSWEFLFEVLRRFGFSEIGISWLRKIFESAKISVLVNGGPFGFFGVGRGFRQGDPLSPILFILAEEVLRRNISKMVQEGKIQAMVTRGNFQPSHLMFADDIFIFCNGHKKSLDNLMNLLSKYQNSSGKVVNRNKSKCFVGGVSHAIRIEIAEYLQMGLSELPDNYLGVILNPGRVKSYQVWEMVELMEKMLAGWMVKKLVTMKWDQVNAPIMEGGLGLRRLEVMNKALLMKLLCKIETKEVEWTQFMRNKYKIKNNEWISSYRQSSIWQGIK